MPLIVLVWVVRRWLQIVRADAGAGGEFFNGLLKDALNEKGLESMVSGLALQPTLLSGLAGEKFDLVGANEQGKLIPDRGWAGFFQYAENQKSGRQLELSELQIETESGDSVEIIKDFINGSVGNVPASIQRMKDGTGLSVISVEWSEGSRSFTLNTKSISETETMEIARQIQSQYRSLPNQGWQKPYRPDTQKPLHRVITQAN
ncbi:MAG: hypothetical protein R3E99_10965 [Burkholderiaceae bacterium]